MLNMTRFIPCPRDEFFPVIRIVAGQAPVTLHDSLGRSPCEKSVLTARYSGAGTCNKGGHSGGLGMGQVKLWSIDEYWSPHTSSHCPSPSVSIQVQPHLFEALSSSLLITLWSRTSSKQRTKGKKMSLTFVPMFRFCNKWTKTIHNHYHHTDSFFFVHSPSFFQYILVANSNCGKNKTISLKQ